MSDDYSWLDEPPPEANQPSASEPASQRRFTLRMPRFLSRLRIRRRAPKAAAQPSASASLLGSQRERPLTELDQRLKALRERSLAPESRDEWAELYDVDQALSSPALQEKPGGVISAVALSQAQQAQVDLLTEIVGGQSNPAQAPARRSLASAASQSLPSMSRLLTVALLLLFVALPFASSEYATGALPPADFADDPQANAYFAALDSLAPGDYVLVAVEYGLGAAAELDALTDLTLRHIFARRARAIFATSNPIAYLHAQNLLENIRAQSAQAGLRLVNGLDYLLLDYLPGGALGIRELSENFADIARRSLRGAPTSLPIDSLTGLKMLVLVADGLDDVRNWVEQALPEAGTRNLYAATSLAASPLTRAYVEGIDRFAGLVVGLRAAYTYGAMLDAALSVDAQAPEQIIEIADASSSSASGTSPLTPPPSPSPSPLPTDTPRPTSTPTPLPTDSPSPTPTTAMLRIVEVTSPQSPVNIRVGPSTAQTVLGLAYKGDILPVLDASADSSWYKVLMSNGWEGWISGNIVTESLVPVPASGGDDSASLTSERTVLSRFVPRRYGKIEPRFSQANQDPSSTLGAIVQLRERAEAAPRLQALTMGTVAAVLAITLGNLAAAIGALFRRRGGRA
ncbi:MAG: SH3 domain-containing protein [Chloroflexi bacterium]|nr:SH3 domain-containing protein [Chloroflexota bacterium]MYH65950.1 SH3 domain-containing protein [Chloroflexota bacterium]